jgi:hypothetical protein
LTEEEAEAQGMRSWGLRKRKQESELHVLTLREHTGLTAFLAFKCCQGG